jgi:hypothetical protein
MSSIHEEQQQNAKWSGLLGVMCADSLLFSFGAQIKVCKHAFWGKGAVSIVWVVAIDLLHYEQHPHPQRCWQKNLGCMVSVNW